MDVQKEQLPKSQVKLTVSISVEELVPYLDRAAAKISKDLKIQGFRPGKAPRDMVEKKVGVMEVYKEALDEVVQKTLPQAVEKEALRIVGSPEISIEKIAPENPLVYTATVALLPQVTLGDAAKVRAEKKPVEIGDEEIAKALEDLQKMRGKEILEDRPAAIGDKVELDLQVFVDKVPIEGGTSKKMPVMLGSESFIPGFEEHLQDIKRDEEREFELEFPKEYHEKNLAGKKATFKVKAHGVFKIELPVLDDAFAKDVGPFKDLEELKAKIRENMVGEKEMKEKQRLELEVLEKMADITAFDAIPDALIESELDRMLEELERSLMRQGGNFDDYLAHIKKTKEALRAEWRDQAEKRVKTALIVAELIDQQEFKVPEAEIDAEVASLRQVYGNNPEAIKQAESLEYRGYIRSVLLNRKAVEWLVKTALGEDVNKVEIKDGQTASGIVVP